MRELGCWSLLAWAGQTHVGGAAASPERFRGWLRSQGFFDLRLMIYDCGFWNVLLTDRRPREASELAADGWGGGPVEQWVRLPFGATSPAACTALPPKKWTLVLGFERTRT